MKKILLVLSGVSLSIVFFSTSSSSAAQSIKPDKATRLKVLASYGRLPLFFTENKGQLNKKVLYYLKGRQGTIYFTKEGMVYDLLSGKVSPSQEPDPPQVKRLSFTLKPLGVNKGVRLIANNKLTGKINYFIGSDPKKWLTGIATYKEIVYQDLYKGIDLKVYGTNNQMEYDFIVSPGSDPGDITMAFEGIDALSVDEQGDLLIKTPLGELRHLKPLIYQEINGRRDIVEGSFRVAKHTVSFDIKDYDKNHPLIIDPLTLSYSTYLGGSDADDIHGIAVDASGNAYVAGSTGSTDFPTQNPYQGTHGGGWDAFVTKLNPGGDSLSYSTYLGGSGDDYGWGGIAVDASGNAYVVGYTDSTDFPTQNPYQGTHGGGDYDAFVTKLNPGGDSLSYSTYLGGSDVDYGGAIAVDASGNAYVAGSTYSTDFPTQNPYQGTYGGGYYDAFVTKLNPGGDSLSYSTYLGGSGADYGWGGIAVDASGNAYVVGYTHSTDFPTQNPYQGTLEGGRDAFVTKLNPGGDSLSYSTYLGGSGDDGGRGIAVDASGNAYVTGWTYSTDFPTQNPYQGTLGGYYDAFVTKLNPGGDSLSYSTYLGGSGGDHGWGGIAVDASGNAYVAGYTESTDFPTQNPYQGIYGDGGVDAFVTKLAPGGDSLSYSTYLGGSGGDDCYCIAVDASGNAYVTGWTTSMDFPTQNPYQGTFGGLRDAFVTKIGVPGPVCLSLIPDSTTVPRGGTLVVQVTITNNTEKAGTVLFGTNVTLPNGNPYPPSGYLFGPKEITFDPHQSKSGQLSHTIPGGAPLGIYTYHGYVGRPGMGIIDEDHFDFEVVTAPALPGAKGWETTVDQDFAE